jgi:hypothetical protein
MSSMMWLSVAVFGVFMAIYFEMRYRMSLMQIRLLKENCVQGQWVDRPDNRGRKVNRVFVVHVPVEGDSYDACFECAFLKSEIVEASNRHKAIYQ